ncbi:MAG: ATP-binding cassette domain-containing protein, partial [Clostridiales bacterium]|nr:ATP-binding cassette domain-containing protein [Clostridiales bacterium]
MGNIIEARQLAKSFRKDETLFEGVNLVLREKEKAALIGPNGAGKTTLLNCLSGRDIYYEGSVKLAPYASIGYLEQTQSVREEDTLLSSVMDVFADLFAQRRRIEKLEYAISVAEGDALKDLLSRYGNEQDQYERSGGFASETQVRRVLHGLGFREDQFARKVGSFSGGEKTRIGLARILVREYPLLFLDEPTNHLDLDAVEWLEGYLKE